MAVDRCAQGDGRVVVHDSLTGETVVDLDLDDV
jgi:hypothetical protein